MGKYNQNQTSYRIGKINGISGISNIYDFINSPLLQLY